MEKQKDLRNMTLIELDNYLRNSGVTSGTNIVIELESGSRVMIATGPLTTPGIYGYSNPTPIYPQPVPCSKKD